MTTQEVLSELSRRGVTPYRGKDGTLRLAHDGHPGRVTPNLLAVLRWHRGEIAARLDCETAPPLPAPAEQPRRKQWLWPVGMLYTEESPGHAEGCNPSGALWWRHEGETAWQVVQGRDAGELTPPEVRLDISEGAPA